MIGIELRLNTETCRAVIPLQRRITYLRGDSGSGKTTICEEILNITITEKYKLEISEGYSVSIQSDLTVLSIIREAHKMLYILDDMYVAETRDFAETIATNIVKNDCYVLIINRADSYRLPKLSVGYSMSSILYAKRASDGVGINIGSVLDARDFVEGSISFSEIKTIVCEDTYGMTEFCECNNKTDVCIFSSHGKDNCIREVVKLINQKNIDNILILADMAVFGRYYSDLILLVDLYPEKQFFVDFNYECFEYAMLCSNLYNESIDLSKANDYISWEKYFESCCENRISSILDINGIQHGSHMPRCLRYECVKCPKHLHKGCNKAINGLKVSTLFKDTKFDYLADVLGGDTNA